MKNDKIEFEKYSQLFENNRLTQKSNDFEMLIKSVARKEKQFIKNIKIKIIEEHINLLNSFNKFWKKILMELADIQQTGFTTFLIP